MSYSTVKSKFNKSSRCGGSTKSLVLWDITKQNASLRIVSESSTNYSRPSITSIIAATTADTQCISSENTVDTIMDKLAFLAENQVLRWSRTWKVFLPASEPTKPYRYVSTKYTYHHSLDSRPADCPHAVGYHPTGDFYHLLCLLLVLMSFRKVIP